MGVVANPDLPFLVLLAGLACALIAWLLATFTQFLRGYRYRVSLGLIAFPLCGLMGLISTMNAATIFGDWLAGKPISFLYAIGYGGYAVFGFLGCWTVVRLAGRLDRKHTLSVLYNLVKERKKRDTL
jgi:hypothetical protein